MNPILSDGLSAAKNALEQKKHLVLGLLSHTGSRAALTRGAPVDRAMGVVVFVRVTADEHSSAAFWHRSA
jgi:hypothetical protein